ncbi:hypothetical protein L596_020523 [Steinernema carpocapsae]|uniref:7TM GPCR serpentine receptor class x (Srx) domain-containing protein n=1 Tax=Steinernema carpocapsae TaxID=34508 RepID=A0A4U5MUJ8_STECR|nr:hypothetical protein L596_020523 [Steinernema carpocapsae]
MIHMGLVQIVYSFGAFWFAILQLCDCDPLTLGTQGIRLTVSAIRAEGLFELILALNRLSIICKIKCPDVLFVVLAILSWVFLFAHQVVFSTSLAGYSAVRGYYVIKTDLTLPHTLHIHSDLGFAYEIILLSALAVYIMIVLHLIYVKWKSKILKDMSKEAKILIYASARNIREEFFCRQPKSKISTIATIRAQLEPKLIPSLSNDQCHQRQIDFAMCLSHALLYISCRRRSATQLPIGCRLGPDTTSLCRRAADGRCGTLELKFWGKAHEPQAEACLVLIINL